MTNMINRLKAILRYLMILIGELSMLLIDLNPQLPDLALLFCPPAKVVQLHALVMVQHQVCFL